MGKTSDRFDVIVDLIANSSKYSVQVNDHRLKKVHILDNSYDSLFTAQSAGLEFMTKILNQEKDIK